MASKSDAVPQPCNEEYEEVVLFPLTYKDREEPSKRKLRTRIEMLKRKYSSAR